MDCVDAEGEDGCEVGSELANAGTICLCVEQRCCERILRSKNICSVVDESDDEREEGGVAECRLCVEQRCCERILGSKNFCSVVDESDDEREEGGGC